MSMEPTGWEQGGRRQQQQGRAIKTLPQTVKPIHMSPTRMSVEPTKWELGGRGQKQQGRTIRTVPHDSEAYLHVSGAY